MGPYINFELKEIDRNVSRKLYLLLFHLLTKFDDILFYLNEKRHILTLQDDDVHYVDGCRLTYKVFKQNKWKYIYKKRGKVYISAGKCIPNKTEECQDTRGEGEYSVPSCTYNSKSNRFVSGRARNKNIDGPVKIFRKPLANIRGTKRYLKPRNVVSLLQNNQDVKDDFRTSQKTDERFLVVSAYPLEGCEYNQPLHLHHPVQESTDIEEDSLGHIPTYEITPNRPEFAHSTTATETYWGNQHSTVPARYPDYQTLQRRLDSFITWPHPSDIQDSRKMAETGLFFIGPRDLVRCYLCGIGLKDWSASEDPILEHIKYSSHCQHLALTIDSETLRHYRSYLISQDQPNATYDSALQNDNPIAPVASYRHPEYINHNVRVSSFSRWPRDIIQTPEQLADAGFFYTGLQDVVRCFACDGGLQRWDPEDDPWIEHTRWFPQCAHVIHVKGHEYINLVRLATEASEAETEDGQIAQGINHLEINENTRPEQPRRESEEPIYSPAAQSVIAFGYSKAAVKMAIEECNNKRIQWKSEDLLNELMEMEDRGEILPTDSPRPASPKTIPYIDRSTKEGLLEERSMLLSKIKCIRCETNDVNVLFLPCAHHRMCMDCVKDVTMCPICGQTIKEKVKTFMG